MTLPRADDGLVDQVPVALPVRVGPTGEQVGDVIPPPPSFRRGRNHAGRETTCDRDLYLLSVLDVSYQLGCLLAKLS